MNEQQFGIPVHILNQICDIFRKYKRIKKVVLYGSRAMGNYRLGSDIDLCIESEELSYSELFAIENQIDDLMIPWKVDLVIKSKIDNPDLLQHIDRVGITIYPNASMHQHLS